MKISIAASVLIALLTLTLGWKSHQNLVAARENREHLENRANELGIPVTETGDKESSRRKRESRAERDLTAKQIALDFIALSKEAEKTKSTPDPDMMMQVTDFMDLFAALDGSQMKIVIAEFQKDPDLSSKQRDGLVGFSLMALSNDRPELALSILTGTPNLFSELSQQTHVVSVALANLAKTNPMAALKWVKEIRVKSPDLITEHTELNLLSAAASHDPKLAFSIIGELGIDRASSAVARIAAGAKTPEERTATLLALREYLLGNIDEKSKREITSSALISIAYGVARTGFEEATQWISTAQFTPDELERFSSGLHYQSTKGDSGKWIQWFGQNLPPQKADQQIRSMISSWTQQDFKAAGEWLVSTPEGPVRNASVRAYAETVSSYDPETAVEWAVTLPEGKDRTSTLKQIHRNWPKNDAASAAAAAAFAAEHGIK